MLRMVSVAIFSAALACTACGGGTDGEADGAFPDVSLTEGFPLSEDPAGSVAAGTPSSSNVASSGAPRPTAAPVEVTFRQVLVGSDPCPRSGVTRTLAPGEQIDWNEQNALAGFLMMADPSRPVTIESSDGTTLGSATFTVDTDSRECSLVASVVVQSLDGGPYTVLIAGDPIREFTDTDVRNGRVEIAVGVSLTLQ